VKCGHQEEENCWAPINFYNKPIADLGSASPKESATSYLLYALTSTKNPTNMLL